MNFVLDASVAMAWCFADEASEYADSVLERLLHGEAVVPALWPIEVTNVLSVAARRDRMSSADVAQAFSLLQALPIVVEPMERRRAFESVATLANEHALTTYDADYLELARRRGIPLATLDEALQAAAEAEGVERLVPRRTRR